MFNKVAEIKITGKRAYTYSYRQHRWFPIAMGKALEMIENGEAKLVEK